MIDLSIIIVSYNTKKLLLDCLRSVDRDLKNSGLTAEVIVVDNGSSDASVEVARKFKVEILENRKNAGFGKANNQGVRGVKGRYILFLNSDTEVKSGALAKMVDFLDKNPKVGIAGCKLLNSDGTIQPQGGYLPRLRTVAVWALFLDDLPILGEILPSYQMRSTFRADPRRHFFGTLGQEPSLTSSSPPGQRTGRDLSGSSSMTSKMASSGQPVGWVGGTAMFVRREAWKQLGGFDEKIFMYGEDVEICYRANKQGWKVAVNPEAEIVHAGKSSGGNWVVGEVKGLLYIFNKHKPAWEMPILRAILTAGMGLRWLIFGILGGNENLRKAYTEAFEEVTKNRFARFLGSSRLGVGTRSE